jgi:hypothetical protein
VSGAKGPVPEANTHPAAFTAWLHVAGEVSASVVRMIWHGMGIAFNGAYRVADLRGLTF